MKIDLERILDDYLEDHTYEEFLEVFDVTPLENTELLFAEGLLDTKLLLRMQAID